MFWAVMACTSERACRFGESETGLLLGLLFDPGDGGGMFLRHIGLSPAFSPEDSTVHSHGCET
jgi:hypothetical protein